MDATKKSARDVVRFAGKYRKNRKNGCWEWTAGIGKQGYGRFKRNGKTRLAHRVSYELHVAHIPSDALVLHKCDNRICVNPDHLFVGTQKDNQLDMKSKKRHVFGEKSPNAKLSESDVLRMYSLYDEGMGTIRLAKMFKITKNLAWRIVRGLQWEHLFNTRYSRSKAV